MIAEKPRTADQLAKIVGVHAGSLYRLLRALASVGVFKESSDNHFENTRLSEAIRAHLPGSVRNSVMILPWYPATLCFVGGKTLEPEQQNGKSLRVLLDDHGVIRFESELADMDEVTRQVRAASNAERKSIRILVRHIEKMPAGSLHKVLRAIEAVAGSEAFLVLSAAGAYAYWALGSLNVSQLAKSPKPRTTECF